MPRREEPVVAGRFYHLYNRGHNRQTIFPRDDDYGLFLRKYRQYVCPAHVTTLAYVLMPNHYHLLVRSDGDGVSHAMQLFAISLAKIVNRETDRVGALFQGPFRAKEVPHDEYLVHLSRYIHLNPVRAKLVERPGDWPYSSCAEYLGTRAGTLPNTELVFSLLEGFQLSGRTPYEKYAQLLDQQSSLDESTSEVEAGLRKS